MMLKKLLFPLFFFNIYSPYALSYEEERDGLSVTSSSCGQASLQTLPDEAKLKIFSFLNLEELVVTARTNKEFFGLIRDQSFLSPIFNGTLEKIKKMVDSKSSTAQESTLIEYIQEYWNSLYDWLSLTVNSGFFKNQNLPFVFLQAFLKVSQASPLVLKDLSKISINHSGGMENDLKKFFRVAIHEKDFLLEFFSPDRHRERQDFIRFCFESLLQETISKIKTFQKYTFLLLPLDANQADQIKSRELFLRLSSEQISILVTYVPFNLFKIYSHHYGNNGFIETCLKLTPQQLETRFKAIHKHASSIFASEMEMYDRTNITANFLKSSEQQIEAIVKYAPSLRMVKEDVDNYGTDDEARNKLIEAYSLLTPEQITVIGTYAPLLFTKNMKIMEKRAVINACAKFTPQEITIRLDCLKKFKDSFFSKRDYGRHEVIIAGLDLTPEQITVIGTYAPLLFIPDTHLTQRGSVMRACLKLTPAEITSKFECIKKHASFIFDVKYPYGPNHMINDCLALTLDQIEVLDHYTVSLLLKRPWGKDERIKTLRAYSHLTPEEIVLRSSCIEKHAASLLPAHNCYNQINAVINAYLELPPKHIEALATKANWLIKWNLVTLNQDNAIKIITACQGLTPEDLIERSKCLEKYISSLFSDKLSSAQQAEMIATYLQFSPEQIDVINPHDDWIFTPDMTPKERNIIIEVYKNLAPTDTTIRLELLYQHRASFLPKELTGEQKSEIITTYLKLEPDQINALGNHLPSLLSKVDSGRGTRTLITACQELRPDQIEVIGKYLTSCLKEDKSGYEHALVIKACIHLSAQEIETKLKTLQKHRSSLLLGNMRKGDQSSILITCLGLTSDQIDAVGIHVCQLFKKYMDKEERNHIIQSCAQLTPEEIASRAAAIQQCGNLVYPRTLNEEKYEDEEEYEEGEDFEEDDEGLSSDFIAKSFQLPVKEITLRFQAIQKHYLSFFPKNIDDDGLDQYSVEELRTTLMGLTADQIDALAPHASLLFKEAMDGEDKSQVIQAYARVMPEEIVSRILAIQEYIYPLLPKNIDGYFYSPIIEQCSKFSPVQIALKAKTILYALSLFDVRMHWREQSTTIWSLLKLTPEQVAAIGEYISSITIKNKDAWEPDRIIGDCKELTPEQITAMGKYVASMVTTDMDVKDLHNIIRDYKKLMP